MLKPKCWIIYMIVGVLLSIIILLTSVQWVAFSREHYNRTFEKYNVSVETGMDQGNLEYVLTDLLSYLRDEKEVLDTRAVIKGEEREVFGERERLHMIDVKELFIKGRLIRNISLVVLGLLFGFLTIKDKGWKRNLSKTLLYTSMGNILLIGLFLLLVYLDFNRYFTYFHLIFFDNDLWILNPKTDILIQMVPEGFFYDTAVKIIGLFVGILGVTGILGFISLRKQALKSVG